MKIGTFVCKWGLFLGIGGVIVVRLLVVPAVNTVRTAGGSTDDPTVVTVETETDPRILDFLEHQSEFMEGLNSRFDQMERRVETVEQAAVPTLIEREIQQQQLVGAIAGIDSFSSTVASLDASLVLAVAEEIYKEAREKAEVRGHRVEWQLLAKVRHLNDQLVAITTAHELEPQNPTALDGPPAGAVAGSGFIPVQDGPNRDKFSDLLMECRAFIALVGQLSAGQTPFYTAVVTKDLANELAKMDALLYDLAVNSVPLSRIEAIAAPDISAAEG